MVRRIDPLSPEQRSERMRRIKAKNTKLELFVRKLIWSLGYRYRLHSTKLPGRPDLVFRSRRKAIFIHGCFWHQHDECGQYRMPKSRLEFWLPKLEANKKRDAKNQKLLLIQKWNFIIVWECQIKDISELKNRITDFLED